MHYRTRLAALLKAKGMTRRALVSFTLPYETIVSWEQDELDSIDPKQLQRVLRALGCTYDELVYPVEETAEPERMSA